MVTQLATAHERQLIHKGCTLKFTVDNPNDELAEPQESGLPNPRTPGAAIKLQIIKKGKLKDEYVDVNLKNVGNENRSWF